MAFACAACGTTFTLPEATLARYPGWIPKHCMGCRPAGGGARAARTSGAGRRSPAAADAAETGVFTDGACSGNPGPGGWGAVRVEDGRIIAERSGGEPSTTNNRMELTALIEGLRLIEPDETVDVYSDSVYVVNIVNEWGRAWEANGWRRGKKREPILNLDLVQTLLETAQSRPGATVRWVRGHAGDRWNEHADALARAYQEAARS